MNRRGDVLVRTVEELAESIESFLRAESIAGRDGFLQRVHPNVKLLGIVALLVATVTVSDAAVLLALLGVSLALAVLSRVPLRTHASRLWFAPALSLVVVAPQAVLVGGPRLVPSLPVTATGVEYVAVFVLRVTASVSFLSLLLLTTRFADLLAGLRRFRVPQVAVTLLAVTHRYLLLFFDELNRMVLARRSRTFRRQGLRRTWRESGNLVGAFLLRALERGERVGRAARARGGTRNPPYAQPRALGGVDAAFVGLVVATVLAVVLA